MSYDLSLQPKDATAKMPRHEVASFLASLPNVRQESPGVFAYKYGRQFLHIYTGEEATIDSIDFSVPAAFTDASSQKAIRLSVQIADHFGWQVFDPQLGDYLDDGDLVMECEDEPTPVTGRFRFADQYWLQLKNHDAVPTIATVIVAAVVAGCFVLEDLVSEDRIAWVFLAAAAVVHAARAFAMTVWDTIRHA